MSKFDTWIDNKITQNVFIWICFFIILTGTITSENKLLSALLIILFLAPAVYINNLFILPYFNKNKLIFFILITINIIFFTWISSYFLSLSTPQPLRLKMFLSFLGVIVLALTFGSALKISRDSYLRRQQEKDAELKLLKAQLNPHFLFNTLNNLYGLSVTKSDKLPDLMLKLSSLLRYSLYETKEMFVPLTKEIRYLENYIALEKIRLEDKTSIKFKVEGDTNTQLVAPMLLIVFVENAFKHLDMITQKKSSVSVNLKIDNDSLIFKCINTKEEENSKSQNLEKGKSGIGLQNAKKRLELMYPSKHQLNINNENNSFIVELKLQF